MAKFRKKPIVIEAVQFFPDRQAPDGVVAWPFGPDVTKHMNITATPHHGIETLEGWHVVSPGDWIIRGVKGELYPCKPDIFEATYDPVTE